MPCESSTRLWNLRWWHRSHRGYAVVPGTSGRAGRGMPGRSSRQDPCGRDPETETRSTGCPLVAGPAADEGSLSGDLDAIDGAAGLANLAARPTSVKMRARLQHTLQAMAVNHALRRGPALWSAAGQNALQALPLPPYSSQRRTELLRLYVQLQKRIQALDKEVDVQARQRPQARRLLTHPGVGAVTALATEVFLGDPNRFATGNQVASYIGMIPCEHSSGKRQRLGKLSKEGNSLLRYLWTEATMHAVGKDPELKRFYRRKLIQKGMGKARIAAARKLGIRLWIMMRDQIDYEEFCRRGKLRQSGEAHAGMPDFNSGPAQQ